MQRAFVRICALTLISLAITAGAAAARAADADPDPGVETNPFADCVSEDFVDCAVCCADKGAAARDACIGAGFSQYFCESLGERVINSCMAQACGVSSTAELFAESFVDAIDTLTVRDSSPADQAATFTD